MPSLMYSMWTKLEKNSIVFHSLPYRCKTSHELWLDPLFEKYIPRMIDHIYSVRFKLTNSRTKVGKKISINSFHVGIMKSAVLKLNSIGHLSLKFRELEILSAIQVNKEFRYRFFFNFITKSKLSDKLTYCPSWKYILI